MGCSVSRVYYDDMDAEDNETEPLVAEEGLRYLTGANRLVNRNDIIPPEIINSIMRKYMVMVISRFNEMKNVYVTCEDLRLELLDYGDKHRNIGGVVRKLYNINPYFFSKSFVKQAIPDMDYDDCIVEDDVRKCVCLMKRYVEALKMLDDRNMLRDLKKDIDTCNSYVSSLEEVSRKGPCRLCCGFLGYCCCLGSVEEESSLPSDVERFSAILEDMQSRVELILEYKHEMIVELSNAVDNQEKVLSVVT